MKLHGVEGMSPEDIRNEVDRGGKLVIYTYCVSVLVLTLKRPTDIRLVRAGHSPVTPGLPFTFISLLFGWWGFPWGPIYTIETIYRNLSGGIDVTHDVLRSILPVAAPGPAASAPASPPLTYAPPAPKPGISLKTIGLMAGVASFLAALGVGIHCYQQQQQLKVALISGLNESYAVTLNGKSYRLGAHGYAVVDLPEGDFTLADAPGGHVVGTPQTMHFSLPFLDHLFTEKMAVINPDGTAIAYHSTVTYYKDGTAPATAPEPVFTLLVNRQSYFIDRPDYILAAAPERVSMPSGTTTLAKTKLDYIRQQELSGILTTLKEKAGYPAVVEHFQLLARQRADERVLDAAMRHLKKEDWAAFFRPRLGERPVQIEWHRYYQRAIEYAEPDHNVEAEYRGYLKTEPANGALLYLTGRATDDRGEAHRLWEQALAANPPCAYAHGAFGFDAMSEGNFAQAADYYLASEKAGISGTAFGHYRQQAYRAQHQFDKALTDIRAERQKAPLDLDLAGTEISVLLEAGPDETAATKVKAAYLAAAKAAHYSDDDLVATKAYLDSIIAYETGRIPAYLEATKHLDSSSYRFTAAITRGDLKAADAAAREGSPPNSHELLLLYVVAKQAANESGADAYFTAAVAAMSKETREHRHAARMLAATTVPADEICQLDMDVDQKRVLLTALGLRDPEHRATYHALAAKLDFNPAFPHLLLRPILGSARL